MSSGFSPVEGNFQLTSDLVVAELHRLTEALQLRFQELVFTSILASLLVFVLP